MASRNLLIKVINEIHHFVQICYLQKFIIVFSNTFVCFMGFRCPKNSIRNMVFIITMGTNMQAFQHMVTYTAESDGVT